MGLRRSHGDVGIRIGYFMDYSAQKTPALAS
jgi:hypothetical protein